MTSDLSNGTFDGTWLVLNFDSLGPANWLWGKQYSAEPLIANPDAKNPHGKKRYSHGKKVYTNIDTGTERFLGAGVARSR
jgi:Protein of unknown function (DUF3141)